MGVLFVEFPIPSSVFEPGHRADWDMIFLARLGDELAADRYLGVKEVFAHPRSQSDSGQEAFRGSNGGGFDGPPEGQARLNHDPEQVIGLIAQGRLIPVPGRIRALAARRSDRLIKAGRGFDAVGRATQRFSLVGILCEVDSAFVHLEKDGLDFLELLAGQIHIELPGLNPFDLTGRCNGNG